VPAHNEEDSIVPLRDAIFQALSANPVEIEIIYVDDGSRDRTRSGSSLWLSRTQGCG